MTGIGKNSIKRVWTTQIRNCIHKQVWWLALKTLRRLEKKRVKSRTLLAKSSLGLPETANI